MRYRSLLFTFLWMVLLSACGQKLAEQAEVRLKIASHVPLRPVNHFPPSRFRTDPASASAMHCFLVNVTGEGVGATYPAKTFANGATNSCLNLGRVSLAASATTATGNGIRVPVRPGPARTIEVLGYYGSLGTSCDGKSVEQLMSDAAAALYPVGQTQADISSDVQVTVSNSYVMGTSENRVDECLSSNGGSGAARLYIWNTSTSTYTDTGLVANSVDALFYESGTLYVGGSFQQAGNVQTANNIARYNVSTSTWADVGGGVNGRVRAITSDGAGKLYIGGDFTDAGNATGANRLASFDGTNFGAPTTGITTGTVFALAHDGSNLYVGGTFTSVGPDVSQSGISVASGSPLNWAPLILGGIGANNWVYALHFNSSLAQLLVGGNFMPAATNLNANKIFSFNGSFINALSSGLNGDVYGIVASGTETIAVGDFVAANSDVNQNYIARHNGSGWFALGTGLSGPAQAITGSSTSFFVGGNFTSAGGIGFTTYVAKWNGSSWEALGAGLNGPVTALANDGSSRVFIGGNFTAANPASRADSR